MRALLLIPILLLSGCGGSADTGRKPEARAAAVPVTTTSAATFAVPSSYEATGTVRAQVSANVSAKLMGYATEVHGQVGDHVNEGQPLVVLDSRDQDAAIRQAEAAREEVRGSFPEADSAIAAAKANSDLAQVSFGRAQDLLNKRSVTQQEFDQAAALMKSAQAALDMARARRSQLDAKLAQAELGIHTAAIQRTYTTVTAPFSGRIVTKSVEPGILVLPGTPIFTLERDGRFRLEANVEESRLGVVRVGQTVAVSVDDRSTLGRISEIVPLVDSASRTGVVKIDLPALPNLRSGLFGRASFAEGQREVLMIPKSAVVEQGQLQSVFVMESQIARTRLITLGTRSGERVEVLSGLREGESVVNPIPVGLKDGAPVEVRP